MKNATIDAIVPVYNGEKFILQALISIERQTLAPQKILVIDDGSTDNTEKIVLLYKEKCRVPITYIKKSNGGPNSARNLGVKNSSADFLAFLDADDEWLPTKLEKQITVFENSQYKNLGAVYCQYKCIQEDGKDDPKESLPILEENQGKIFDKLLQGNIINSSSSGIMIKKECFENVGLFDESLRTFEDWDMWLRISEKYDFAFAKEALTALRTHPWHTQYNKELMFKSSLIFYSKWTNILLEKYTHSSIPRKWSMSVLKNIIKRLPRIDFLNMFLKNTSFEFKKILFKKILSI